MTQGTIEDYYRQCRRCFSEHIKATIEALEKVWEMSPEQITEQQYSVIRGLKAIYTGQLVEDIEGDLKSGHITMETVEKRVQLDVEAYKIVIDQMNLTPIEKIFLDLLFADHVSAMRMNLGNMVLLLNNALMK